MKPEIRKATDADTEKVASWGVWTKEVSEFPWEYDEQETCYILEGHVVVTNEDGDAFEFGAGDWVVFPKGMKCTWKITQPVQKRYFFG